MEQSQMEVVSVFDPNFKFLYEVPSHLVVHMPPARLNITRLVICRNYKPNEPSSCVMGNNCKFVHADVDVDQLEAQPVHVNYIWRHEDLCTYNRLQPGEQLEVLLPNNRQPAEMIPSECILKTQAFAASMEGTQMVLSHCAHYYFNRLCNRGEGCSFVHAVCVDPNVRGEFKRATGRPRRYRSPIRVGVLPRKSNRNALHNPFHHRRHVDGATAQCTAADTITSVESKEATLPAKPTKLNSFKFDNPSSLTSSEGPSYTQSVDLGKMNFSPNAATKIKRVPEVIGLNAN